MRAMVMTHTLAKGQDQTSLSSTVRVEKREDKRADEAIALPPVLTRSLTRDVGSGVTDQRGIL